MTAVRFITDPWQGKDSATSMMAALSIRMVWALQTPLAELTWLPSQPPFFTATHILPATDSLSSLHQIKKQLLYPELHRQHVQGDIL